MLQNGSQFPFFPCFPFFSFFFVTAMTKAALFIEPNNMKFHQQDVIHKRPYFSLKIRGGYYFLKGILISMMDKHLGFQSS